MQQGRNIWDTRAQLVDLCQSPRTTAHTTTQTKTYGDNSPVCCIQQGKHTATEL